MKILKFGGKSLQSGLDLVIDIITNKAKESAVAVVVSAVGETTDILERLLELAKKQEYRAEFQKFTELDFHRGHDLSTEFDQLRKLLEGVSLLGEYNRKIKDRVLAFGELIAARILAEQLSDRGLGAVSIDSREFFVAGLHHGNALINDKLSREKTKFYFARLDKAAIPVVTGFIAASADGDTVTLGRNGSNYSAALLADFLDAEELQNFTHVDGIYTANPDWVKEARKIEHLHFDDAAELATFGASILHSKTIVPLLRNNIPLRILNTLNPENSGTVVSANPTRSGIKSISAQTGVSLVQLEGRGLLGKVGVDGRVFKAMAAEGISVGLISQGSSERGLGFVVTATDGPSAAEALKREFAVDIEQGDVSAVGVQEGLSVISIVGIELKNFDGAFSALVKNKIVPTLFSNSLTGRNVSVLVKDSEAKKAVNVIHGRIFGMSKKVNLAIFGHGTVGGTLIKQIQESAEAIERRKNIRLNIFAIGNSQKLLRDANGIGDDWQERLNGEGQPYSINDVIAYAERHHLENLIAVDNTACALFIENYITLVRGGFDLVSSNKVANTLSYDSYVQLRESLKIHRKEYLYETNVGAGLPLIDTIKLLHLSGENITRIRGVFSGSLSFIFNKFSGENVRFSEVLKEAAQNGYTEPDPREDLSGNDVARKLLILARELDLRNEFSEIEIENLIPDSLTSLPITEFLQNLDALDARFDKRKENLAADKVLRYVGDLSGDLSGEKGTLRAYLDELPAASPLGQLTESDSLFEIYTESYGSNPIIIRGAGAGAAVTARGVFGDILRLAAKTGAE